MTTVVIVSRTRMGNGVCIGGLSESENRNLRLLPASGAHSHPSSAPYQIGEIWDMDLVPPAELEPPHIEDVLVRRARRSGVQQDLQTWLLAHVEPWRGDGQVLFDGLLVISGNGSAYISRQGVPDRSVGFWIPDADLEFTTDPRRGYLVQFGWRTVTVGYVGVAEPAPLITAGSLVRVSLARWWSPGGADFEACWLQISGCYAW
jgi:hypothetical protein